MKKLRSLLSLTALMLALAVVVPSCKSGPSDAELTTAVQAATAGTPGVSVTVKDGTVTLAGEVADDIAKTNAENAAKGVEGVKGVANNLTVKPVVINTDAALTNSVNAALTAYPGITATVADGVVTLRGEVKKADLQKLMETMQGLNPKKVDNQLSVK